MQRHADDRAGSLQHDTFFSRSLSSSVPAGPIESVGVTARYSSISYCPVSLPKTGGGTEGGLDQKFVQSCFDEVDFEVSLFSSFGDGVEKDSCESATRAKRQVLGLSDLSFCSAFGVPVPIQIWLSVTGYIKFNLG